MTNKNKHKVHMIQVMLFVIMHVMDKSIQMEDMREEEFELVRQFKQELTEETAQ